MNDVIARNQGTLITRDSRIKQLETQGMFAVGQLQAEITDNRTLIQKLKDDLTNQQTAGTGDAALQQTIADKDIEIADLKATVVKAQESVRTIGEDRDDQRKEVVRLEALQKLQASAPLQTTIDDLNKQITTLTAERDAATASLTAVDQTAINNLKDQITTLTGERDAATASLAAVDQTAIDNLNNQITTLTGERDAARTSLAAVDQTVIDNLNNQITTLTGERDAATASLAAVDQTAIDNLNDQIKTLTAERDVALNTVSTATQTTLDDLNQQITNLKDQLAISNTALQNAPDQDQIDNLNKQITDLTALHDQAVKDLAAAPNQAAIDALITERDDLQTQIQTLQVASPDAALQAQIDTLETERDQLQQKLLTATDDAKIVDTRTKEAARIADERITDLLNNIQTHQDEIVALKIAAAAGPLPPNVLALQKVLGDARVEASAAKKSLQIANDKIKDL